MPSPFPGMDPFVEWSRRWHDFHTSFISDLSDALLAVLPGNYDAPIEEQLAVVERAADEPPGMYGDVVVVETDAAAAAASPARRSGGGTMTLEPVMLPMIDSEIESHPWVEIRTLDDDRVVTIIEVLSPTNKRGAGRFAFASKRSAALRRGVNWIEIDLLLGGHRLRLGRPLPRGDYYAHVIRGDEPAEAAVYAWSLRDPLPTVPVPLTPADGAVPLDLAAVFATTYDRRRYGRRLRYDADPTETDEPTRNWTRGILAARA